MRKHLTSAVVGKLPNPAERAEFVHDTKLTGFCISVSPLGRKSFWFYGRVNGRPKRIKIGDWPKVTANNAREVCKGIAGDIAKGVDVAANRAKGRRTLGDLFTLYLNSHAKLKKRTWERDVVEFDRFYAGWKGKPISEIRRGMVSEKIAELVASNGKGAAHKARALLSKMFSIAVKHEWCEYNPVTGTDRPTFESRDRYLRPDEVGKFLAAVDELQRETTRDFIKLAIYTGARRSNLAEMEWSELDLERGLWTIPREKFKGKKSKVIPLIPDALDILRKRHDERAEDNPWVFPGGGKGGHIVEPKAAMDRVKTLSGITDLRFHDLRRSLGAWMNSGGTSTRLIQQALGHANIATTAAAYTPGDHEAIRAATAAAVANAMAAGKVVK